MTINVRIYFKAKKFSRRKKFNQRKNKIQRETKRLQIYWSNQHRKIQVRWISKGFWAKFRNGGRFFTVQNHNNLQKTLFFMEWLKLLVPVIIPKKPNTVQNIYKGIKWKASEFGVASHRTLYMVKVLHFFW